VINRDGEKMVVFGARRESRLFGISGVVAPLPAYDLDSYQDSDGNGLISSNANQAGHCRRLIQHAPDHCSEIAHPANSIHFRYFRLIPDWPGSGWRQLGKSEVEATHPSLSCFDPNASFCSANEFCLVPWLSALDIGCCCPEACKAPSQFEKEGVSRDGQAIFTDVHLDGNGLSGIAADPVIPTKADVACRDGVNFVDMRLAVNELFSGVAQ